MISEGGEMSIQFKVASVDGREVSKLDCAF